MAEPNYADERRLPDGMTCAECRHGSRCEALFGARRRRFTSYDFWPSRFSAFANAREGQSIALESTKLAAADMETVSGDSTHEWIERYGMKICGDCGIVRRRDELNSSCRGKVKVALRDKEDER